MSDDDTAHTPQEASQAPAVQKALTPPPERDWFLLEFVRLAELGIEQGITLSIGGSLVTGTAISGRKFFELMSEEVDRAKDVALGDTGVYDSLKQNYEHFRTMVEKVEEDPEIPFLTRNYIHLRDARVLFGNGSVPSSGGVLWRGRVQAVDAFFSGSITRV